MCEGEALKNLQYTDPILYILLFFNFLKLHFFYYGKIVTEYCNFFKLFLLLLLLLLLLYGGSLKKKKEILNIGIYAIFSEAYRAFFTDFKIANDLPRSQNRHRFDTRKVSNCVSEHTGQSEPDPEPDLECSVSRNPNRTDLIPERHQPEPETEPQTEPIRFRFLEKPRL